MYSRIPPAPKKKPKGRTLRDKISGRFKGSIGAGKTHTPQPATLTTPPTLTTKPIHNKTSKPFNIIVDRTKIPPLKPITEMVINPLPRQTNKTGEDYVNKYTGGECYELAYHIHKSNPKRYPIFELSTQETTKRYGAHWFVQDQQTGHYIDINGKTLNPQDILTNFPDWEEWKNPQIRQLTEKEFMNTIQE